MKKIGVISDTHSFWDDSFDKYFSNCDEIWHAGDIGNLKITDKLKKLQVFALKNLVSIKCYKGIRKIQGLPVRGQRTHTNAKTSKKNKKF